MAFWSSSAGGGKGGGWARFGRYVTCCWLPTGWLLFRYYCFCFRLCFFETGRPPLAPGISEGLQENKSLLRMCRLSGTSSGSNLKGLGHVMLGFPLIVFIMTSSLQCGCRLTLMFYDGEPLLVAIRRWLPRSTHNSGGLCQGSRIID